MSLMVKSFEKLVKDSGLDIFINNIRENRVGLSYDFDGKLTCHVILHNGKFYDLVDRFEDDLEIRGDRSFSTLEELIAAIAKEVILNDVDYN